MGIVDKSATAPPSECTLDRTAEVAAALGRAERAVTARLSEVLRLHSCSVEAWRAVRMLADGQRHSMAQLAEAALIPGPSLTRLVDKLVADNLVYRLVDENDRRRVLVYLTRRGRALHQRVSAHVEEEREAILGRAVRPRCRAAHRPSRSPRLNGPRATSPGACWPDSNSLRSRSATCSASRSSGS